MIIVEGMDGTGKSGLIKRLSDITGIPIHTRASSSVEGPVRDLVDWAEEDVTTWGKQPAQLYDRHPLVSEYIYGPCVRGQIDPMFYGPIFRQLSYVFRNNALVIFCDPGWEAIKHNLDRNPANQMPGVMDNSRRLHLLYRSFRHNYSGRQRVWDYGREPIDANFQELINLVEGHALAWSRRVMGDAHV